MMDAIEGPFGPARRVESLAASHVERMYRDKCGLTIRLPAPDGMIHLYECAATGYRFWRPEEIAGDEAFYQALDGAWPHYYQTSRWEYAAALKAIRGRKRILEVGSGRGYFLRAAEKVAGSGKGLELNRDAIARKVTSWPIEANSIEAAAQAEPGAYDAVCTFQVLEHVTQPASFLRACVEALAPGGLLVVSTPDADFMPHRLKLDAFDLPPHHMGHFSPDTYARIAPLLGLELVQTVRQPRRARAEEVAAGTKRSLSWKVARALAFVPMTLAYRLNKEPGQTVLAILRKPA